VVAEESAISGREAVFERDLPVEHGGWIAARVAGGAKTHANYSVFAHTSPVYLRVTQTPFRRAEAAGSFIDEIEESVRFIRKAYRFASDRDRALALGRFEAAKSAFGKVAAET
jgi:hypothetical protein